MSTQPDDAAWDEFVSKLTEELYPEQYERAVLKFTRDRLRSYYIQNPRVLAPVVDMYFQSKELYAADLRAPAVVFYVSTLELLLKAVVLSRSCTVSSTMMHLPILS